VIFVGREIETKNIIKELCRGKNIIVGGKYGIGRTSMIKEIASLLQNKWHFIFVDFSQTPGKMSAKLMKEFHISKINKQTGKQWGYKSMRYRIANAKVSKRKNTVIVFDNVAKLTPQKIIFLRNLIEENHFQFIAIVENFLPANDLMLLRAQFFPAQTFALHHLKDEEVISFIRLHAEKYHLNWSEAYIHSLASLAGGYPLGIIEMLKNKKRSGV
jgi:replication-associated recombination protein RarA